MLLIVAGLVFALIAGLLFKVCPPKKINHIFGWRSRFSMKSQSIWDEAQRYSANVFIITGIILSLLGAILYLFFDDSNSIVIIQYLALILSVVIIYIICEVHLRNLFNEDGTRKVN